MRIVRRRQSALLAVPAGHRSSRARFPRVRQMVDRLTRIVVGLGLMVGTLVGVGLSVAPAQAADPACIFGGGTNSNVGPEAADVGVTAWLPTITSEDVPDDPSGRQEPFVSDHTLWEVVGARGLLWSYAKAKLKPLEGDAEFDRERAEENLDEECSPVDASIGYVAQLLFEGSRFLGGLTIGMKQLATVESPFAPFYDEQQSLISRLRTNVFIPAMTLGLVIMGGWVMVRMRRRDDARETYSGILVAAAVTIALVVVLTGSNYLTLTKAIDRYSTEFNSELLNVMSDQNKEPDEGKSDPCYLPRTTISNQNVATSGARGAKKDPEGGGGGTYNRGQRVSTCMLYKILLYNPWANGQFGTSDPLRVDNLCYRGGGQDDDADKEALDKVNCDTKKRYVASGDICQYSPYRCELNDRERTKKGWAPINLGVQQVIAQAYTRDETLDEDPAVRESYNALWKGVQYAVGEKYPSRYSHWKGAQPSARLATGLSAGVMNLVLFVMVGILAVLTVFWHGVMFVAWILLPVAGAVAIIPPARRILRSVAGILVQAVFLRCVLGLVLVVLLAIMNTIQIADGNTAMKIILMIIAAAAIWKILTALRDGQLSPEIVREAGEAGAVPSDRVATGATAAGLGRVQRTAASAVRQTRATVAGAAEGYRTAQHESRQPVGSRERRREVLAGMVGGARVGRRTATLSGRRRIEAERVARHETQYSQIPPGWIQEEERQAREKREDTPKGKS